MDQLHTVRSVFAMRRGATLLVLGMLTLAAVSFADGPTTKPATKPSSNPSTTTVLQPDTDIELPPPPLDSRKLVRISDGMTMRAIIDILGPGWMGKSESVGIYTWFFDDGRRLRIQPDSYKPDEVVNPGLFAKGARMWIEPDTSLRPVTRPLGPLPEWRPSIFWK